MDYSTPAATSKLVPESWKYPNRDPMATVVACADFAARKHRTQRRKDGRDTPYINHPLGVAQILTDEGKVSDLKLIQVAILHDTVEDTDTFPEELVENFGIEVTKMVLELTDNQSLPRKERKRLQIEHVPSTSPGAKIVRMCDKIYNLRDMAEINRVGWTEEKRQKYYVWAEKVAVSCYAENELLATILKNFFETNMQSPQ